MSFGESVFSARFIQKTIMVDQHVRFNCAYPQQNRHQKVLEDSRGLHTKAEDERLPSSATRSHLQGPAPGPTYQPPCHNVGSPPPPRLHLRRSLSRFDSRAHVGRSGLYIPAYTPLQGMSHLILRAENLETQI